MRSDFNKLLVESPRIGSSKCFGETRHNKRLKFDDEVGGRESMRKRYKIQFNAKSFNENLSPLVGWLNKCVGKNWDKCYSDLRTNFDARSVINNHILEHLFGYIETKTFIDPEGRSMYSVTGYSTRGAIQCVEDCGSEFYVCPKSGVVVKNKNIKSKRFYRDKYAAEQQAMLHAEFRALDDKTHLRLQNGVWYALTVDTLPQGIKVVKRPYQAISDDHVTIQIRRRGRDILKSWNEMNQSERESYGRVVIEGAAKDAWTGTLVSSLHRHEPTKGLKNGFYYSSKKSANSKQLRAGRIDVDATEDKPLPHRQASKYRAKA